MAEPGRAGPPLAGRLAPTGLSKKAPPTATVRALARTDAHTGINPRVYVTEATVRVRNLKGGLMKGLTRSLVSLVALVAMLGAMLPLSLRTAQPVQAGAQTWAGTVVP